MERLDKKTTILFPPDLYRRLEEVGKAKGISVGELIRRAVKREYQLGDAGERMAAVERLTRIETPVSDWEELEKEISQGAIER